MYKNPISCSEMGFPSFCTVRTALAVEHIRPWATGSMTARIFSADAFWLPGRGNDQGACPNARNTAAQAAFGCDLHGFCPHSLRDTGSRTLDYLHSGFRGNIPGEKPVPPVVSTRAIFFSSAHFKAPIGSSPPHRERWRYRSRRTPSPSESSPGWGRWFLPLAPISLIADGNHCCCIRHDSSSRL